MKAKVAFVAGFLLTVWGASWLYWLVFRWYGALDDWAALPFQLTAFAAAIGAGLLLARLIK